MDLTLGAKASTMIVSFSATWLGVKSGSAFVGRLQRKTIAVQCAAASRIRPATRLSSWCASRWRTKSQPSSAIEMGLTAQLTNSLTPMPRQWRRTP